MRPARCPSVITGYTYEALYLASSYSNQASWYESNIYNPGVILISDTLNSLTDIDTTCNIKKQTVSISVVGEPAKNKLINDLLGPSKMGDATPAPLRIYVPFLLDPSDTLQPSITQTEKYSNFTVKLPKIKKEYSISTDSATYVDELIQRFNINFLSKKFEDAISPFSVKEISLPNFYETCHQNFSSPTGSITGDYFSSYADNIPNTAESEKYQEIGFDIENYRNLNVHRGYESSFPLASICSCNASYMTSTSHVYETVENSYLDIFFYSPALAYVNSPLTEFVHPDTSRWTTIKMDPPSIPVSDTKIENFIPMGDLLENMNSIISGTDPGVSFTDLKYLGSQDTISIKMVSPASTPIDRLIASSTAESGFKKICNENILSIEDMAKGKENYSEILYYQIYKYLGPPGSLVGPDKPDGPIQIIYLPNIPDIDPLDYIDTQVKYGTAYSYKIVAWTAVVSTEYFYAPGPMGPGTPDIESTPSGHAVITKSYGKASKSEAKPIDSELFTMKVDVYSYPALKILPVEYFTYEAEIIDSPPPPPEVSILPYEDVDNEILMLFSAQTSHFEDSPIIMDAQDAEYIDKLKQFLDYVDGDPILFSLDDELRSFYIYRTSDYPTSYDDFADKLHKIVTTSKLGESQATSLGLNADTKDFVKPNKTYYYIFRAVDQHGNKSNPTDVFSVTMMNDVGAIYPVIDVISWEKIFQESVDSPMEPKNFQKLLQIKPTYNQSVLNYESSGLVSSEGILKSTAHGSSDKIVLGAEEKSLWDKNFKVRITSKSSGKKIDLNISFKVENQ